MPSKQLKDNLNTGKIRNPLEMLQGVSFKGLEQKDENEDKVIEKIQDKEKAIKETDTKQEKKKKKNSKANETGVFFQTTDDMKFKIEEFQLKLRRKVTGKKPVPVKLIMHAALEVMMDDFERNGTNSRFFEIIEDQLANE